jgi:hypothetical protein
MKFLGQSQRTHGPASCKIMISLSWVPMYPSPIRASQRIPSVFMPQPRNTELGEFVAFVASGSKPAGGGRRYYFILQVACHEHNPEK